MHVMMWFRTCFSAAGVSRQLLFLNQRLSEVEKDKARLINRLASRREELEGLTRRLELLSVKVSKDIEDSAKLQQRYEEELTAVRSQLRVAEETTIPSLVASHKLILARYDAETAIQIRRQVASSTQGME